MTRLSKWLARVKMPSSLSDMFHPSNPNPMFASHKPSQSSPKDTATSPHTLHYVLVLDRSGSMMDRMDEVRHAVNDQIATLRREAEEDNNTCLLTVVRFDTEIEPIVVEQNVRDVQPLTAQDVRPRGMTALVDATVLTIEQAALQIGARLMGRKRVWPSWCTQTAEKTPRVIAQAATSPVPLKSTKTCPDGTSRSSGRRQRLFP